MGWFTSIAKGVGGAISTVSHIPGAGLLLKSLPVVGTVATVGAAAYDVFGPKSTPTPGGFAGQPGPGDTSIFRNDPNVDASIKNQVISMAGLRTYYRAPRGYVIRHDQKGDPMGVPKHLARKMPDAVRKDSGWKPAHKPLLTGGQMNSIRKAENAIKHLQKVGKDLRFIQHAMHPQHAGGALEKAIQAKYKVLETKALIGGKK